MIIHKKESSYKMKEYVLFKERPTSIKEGVGSKPSFIFYVT
jgi:hypothetical protein